MSRTYRLTGYKKGKPQYSKNENQSYPYRFYRKDNKIARKKYYRAYRRKQKQYLQKYHEYLPFVPTCGWLSW